MDTISNIADEQSNADEVVYPVVKKNFTRPQESFILLYTQSQSPYAWATFESQLREGQGYHFNDTAMFVETSFTNERLEALDSIHVPEFQGIPVRLTLVDSPVDHDRAFEGYNDNFSKLGAVYFRNRYPTDPFLLAVGYYQQESITHLIEDGCEGIRIEIFVDNPEDVEDIVFLAQIMK